MQTDETRFELPEFFVSMLREQYGETHAERVIRGCSATRAVTLRANTLKSSREEVAEALDAAGISWSGVPWSPEAFVLDGVRERAVWDLDVYGEGKVYLQSLSSMLPPIVLGPRAGADVLDMAAAPGGKTTQMAALSGGKARITATELNGPRAQKLEYNLQKQGVTCVNVMRADARRLDDFFTFDQVLLDAPCTGSGTLSTRDPKMPKRFTPELLAKSTKSQRALIARAGVHVKVGECIVYSTCSVLRQENEDAVRSLLKTGRFEVVPVGFEGMGDLPCLPTAVEGTLCVCPTELYEGFFVAKLRRLA